MKMGKEKIDFAWLLRQAMRRKAKVKVGGLGTGKGQFDILQVGEDWATV